MIAVVCLDWLRNLVFIKFFDFCNKLRNYLADFERVKDSAMLG